MRSISALIFILTLSVGASAQHKWTGHAAEKTEDTPEKPVTKPADIPKNTGAPISAWHHKGKAKRSDNPLFKHWRNGEFKPGPGKDQK
jgi:hypothetical protein